MYHPRPHGRADISDMHTNSLSFFLLGVTFEASDALLTCDLSCGDSYVSDPLSMERWAV